MGTQSQFLENICSEHDLRCRIFGTFVVEFLACLPLLGSSNILKSYNCPFVTDFYPKKVTWNSFREPFFLAEIFEKVSFDPFNFRTTRLSSRKSEQMKKYKGIKICLYLPFKC